MDPTSCRLNRGRDQHHPRDGTRNKPACVTEAKPVAASTFGVSTNCGMSTKELYIPKPIRNPLRFVVQTPLSRIM